MKVLLLSDLAGKIPDIPANVVNQVDFALIAGDVTLGARSLKTLEKFFIKLANFLPAPLPVYFIPGNHDHAFIMEKYPWTPENFIELHGKTHVISGDPDILLIGFGGASIGLYNNFAFTEDEIYASLKNLFQGSSGIRGKPTTRTILFVHDVPRNSKLDLNYRKEHVGSVSIRKIIEEFKPSLMVGGHIHESMAVDRIGPTLAVNAGEGKYGHYALITIEKNEISCKLL
ncbi:MAG: metallophosphoesterase [Candidatus Hodarchaeota archaeon]